MTRRPRLGAADIRPEPAPTVNRTLETAVNQPTETDLRDRIADVLRPWLLGADEADVEHAADAVLAVLPAPAELTAVERTMLTYALDQAQEHIWSRDGFTDEDQAAVNSLRRMAAEARGAQQDDAPDGQGDGPTWSDTCPHCNRWYTTSEPGAHEATCPMRPTPQHTGGTDRVVGYRLGGQNLSCVGCTPTPRGDIWEPVTSEDLPDGGACSKCGVDVLIPQEPQS